MFGSLLHIATAPVRIVDATVVKPIADLACTTLVAWLLLLAILTAAG